MPRYTGNTNLTTQEREFIIGLIGDYSMFRASENEIRQMIEKKTGRNLSHRTITLFKSEWRSRQKQGEQWLDGFVGGEIAEYYRDRIKEVEYVLKTLLKLFEDENVREHPNKYLMNQLAKTINDLSKTLADYGLAPPVLNKIKSLMPVNIIELQERRAGIIQEGAQIKQLDNKLLVDIDRIKSAASQDAKYGFRLGFDTEDNAADRAIAAGTAGTGGDSEEQSVF